MEVTYYDDVKSMFDDLEKAKSQADSRVKEWQTKLMSQDYFLTIYDDLLIVNYIENYYTGDLQHYRYCRSYSLVVPDGELGDVHISEAIIKLCPECAKSLIAWFNA